MSDPINLSGMKCDDVHKSDVDAFVEAMRKQTQSSIAAMHRQIFDNVLRMLWWESLPWWKKACYRIIGWPRRVYWRAWNCWLHPEEEE